jgi:glycerol-3-phosphate dehydrogenase (NAD(P)+)
MGTALTTPLIANGRQTRLWGTELDREILAGLRSGAEHPRIGVAVDPNVLLFEPEDLGEALAGAGVVVLAISSDGVLDILGRAGPYMQAGRPLVFVTKGFGRDEEGRISLLPPLLEAALPHHLRNHVPIVAVGGPCKANEVGAGYATATVYGSRSSEALATCHGLFATQRYRIQLTDDITGLEVSAAMKNVYAIALGVCDGLQEGDGHPRHDLKAAVFTRAVEEMRLVAEALGGRSETVTGFAGVGDLEVTGLSGRNRAYGERLGRGEPAADALREMQAAGQTVEGHPAAHLAVSLVDELADDGDLDPVEMPLLGAIELLLSGSSDVENVLAEAVMPDPSGQSSRPPLGVQ